MRSIIMILAMIFALIPYIANAAELTIRPGLWESTMSLNSSLSIL